MMLQIIPCEPATLHFALSGDLALEPILRSIAVAVRMPVVKLPRLAIGKYSDSELATVAMMMEKIREGSDSSTAISVEDEVLDVVTDRLIGELR